MSAPTNPLADLIAIGAPLVNQEDLVMSYDMFVKFLRQRNRGADTRYQTGDYEGAEGEYNRVIRSVEKHSSYATKAMRIKSACDKVFELKSPEYAEYRTPQRISLMTLVVVDTVTQLVEPILTGAYIVQPHALVTEAAALRLPAAVGPYFFSEEFKPAGGGVGEGIDSGDDDAESTDPLKELGEILPAGAGGTSGYSPGTGNVGGGTTGVVVKNTDAVEIEYLHALTYLRQLRNGLNWLGFDPDTVPVWRFDHLLAQARYYAERADALQQRAMALLQGAEGEYEKMMAALNNQAIAQSGIEVAKAQQAVMDAQATAATKSREAADAIHENSKDDVRWAWAQGGAAIISAATSGAFGGWGKGDAAGPIFGAVGGAVSAAVNMAAAIDAAVEATEAAQKQAEVALAQENVAAEQAALAEIQVDMAELQSAQASELVRYLTEDKQFGVTALMELGDAASSAAISYLRMANRMAWLAERAYQWETKRNSAYIQMSYERFGSRLGKFASGQALLGHLDALAYERVAGTTERYQLMRTSFSLLGHSPSSLVALQTTGRAMWRLPQRDLDLRFPGLFLHSVKRVEVEFDGLFPASGVHAVLRVLGNTWVRVPYSPVYAPKEQLVTPDWAYPDVSDDAGNAYSIADAQDSLTLQAPDFVQKPVNGYGFSQVLSEYRRSVDSVVLTPPEGALDAFEHLPTDLLWDIEVPRQGNGFPLSNISDVRFVIYFTAHYSAKLAARQQQQLKEEFDAAPAKTSLPLLASTHAPDALAGLVTTPADTAIRDCRLLVMGLGAADFPHNLKAKRVENFSLALMGDLATPIVLHVACTGAPFGASATTAQQTANPVPQTPDGMVFSAVGDTSNHQIEVDTESGPVMVTVQPARAGTFSALDAMIGVIPEEDDNVIGTWVVKILPEQNTGRVQLTDDGGVLSVATGALELPNGGGSTYAGTADWTHAEVTAHVLLTEGTFTITLRQGSANAVSATITVGALSAGKNPVTVSLGGTTSPEYQVALDPVYRVTLRVLGSKAAILVDEVQVVEKTGLTPASGSLGFGFTGSTTPAEIYDVRVTRLRHDGTALEEVVYETFADATAWTNTGGASRVASTHNLLDLSGITDAFFVLDYTAKLDVIPPSPVEPAP